MKLVNFRKIKRRGEERAKNGGSTKLSVVRGGHKIDLGRRSPWWSGGRMEHHCVVRANNIKQTAWVWSFLFIISKYRLDANNIKQTSWWWSALNNTREESKKP